MIQIKKSCGLFLLFLDSKLWNFSKNESFFQRKKNFSIFNSNHLECSIKFSIEKAKPLRPSLNFEIKNFFETCVLFLKQNYEVLKKRIKKKQKEHSIFWKPLFFGNHFF